MKISKKKKRCLVFYFGNGYSEKEFSQIHGYEYSIDMRENKQNHEKTIFKPLRERGYSVDVALVTNKHEHYDLFVKEYNAINIEYDDFTSGDYSNLYNYYTLKVPEMFGPGFIISGGRFLKIKNKIPEYDLYIFVRADCLFKKSLDQLNVDYKKINYLWPESDDKFFNENREVFLSMFKTEHHFWNSYKRVNGNILNVVPKKYINVFLTYYWLEHMSLYLMIKDLYPLIQYPKDIHLICGEEKAYSSNTTACKNPIYISSKKIH